MDSRHELPQALISKFRLHGTRDTCHSLFTQSLLRDLSVTRRSEQSSQSCCCPPSCWASTRAADDRKRNTSRPRLGRYVAHHSTSLRRSPASSDARSAPPLPARTHLMPAELQTQVARIWLRSAVADSGTQPWTTYCIFASLTNTPTKQRQYGTHPNCVTKHESRTAALEQHMQTLLRQSSM